MFTVVASTPGIIKSSVLSKVAKEESHTAHTFCCLLFSNNPKVTRRDQKATKENDATALHTEGPWIKSLLLKG